MSTGEFAGFLNHQTVGFLTYRNQPRIWFSGSGSHPIFFFAMNTRSLGHLEGFPNTETSFWLVAMISGPACHEFYEFMMITVILGKFGIIPKPEFCTVTWGDCPYLTTIFR